MSGLLSTMAVSRRSESDAATILQAYIATGPQMVQTHAMQAAPAAPRASAAPGPGGMGGGGGKAPAPGAPKIGQQQDDTGQDELSAAVAEHEVFKNGRNALAFFFYRQPTLDTSPEEGPFWFTIQEDRIIAGTEEAYAVFEDVTPEILNAARQRGVIMLVEFENQQPYRCTPCYFSDSF